MKVFQPGSRDVLDDKARSSDQERPVPSRNAIRLLVLCLSGAATFVFYGAVIGWLASSGLGLTALLLLAFAGAACGAVASALFSGPS